MEYHEIPIHGASEIVPLVADLCLRLGLVVIKMVAFCFNHQDLAAGRHSDNIRISVNCAVNLEAETGDVPMPPLDVVHG